MNTKKIEVDYDCFVDNDQWCEIEELMEAIIKVIAGTDDVYVTIFI